MLVLIVKCWAVSSCSMGVFSNDETYRLYCFGNFFALNVDGRVCSRYLRLLEFFKLSHLIRCSLVFVTIFANLRVLASDSCEQIHVALALVIFN